MNILTMTGLDKTLLVEEFPIPAPELFAASHLQYEGKCYHVKKSSINFLARIYSKVLFK